MNFNTWLDTFIEEKGIDLEESFDFYDNYGYFHLMFYGVVIEAFKNACESDQKAIKNKIVEMDFLNQDVKHFLRAMGKVVAMQ